MPQQNHIEFQEISTSATDFLHELNDPALLQNGVIPRRAACELRRQQLSKLRENIEVLTIKREEFNRKVDDYIENLRALIRSVEKSNSGQLGQSSQQEDDARQATVVHCLRCDTQKVFRDVHILFARESEESFAKPTEVYVLNSGRLKKGMFSCRRCGTSDITIRSC